MCINRTNKTGVGVRRDNNLYYDVIRSQCEKMLGHKKPCLCGSNHHATTKHRDCPLNPKYDDAYE